MGIKCPTYCVFATGCLYLLLLRHVQPTWQRISSCTCIHPLSSKSGVGNMGMEDISEGNVSEAQNKLEREEKQSVQGNVAIKGTRNGLLLTLEPETPFGELLKALSERLAEAPGFFRGASLSVDTSRRILRVSERTQLEALLAHYQMSIAPLEASSATRDLRFPASPPVTTLP